MPWSYMKEKTNFILFRFYLAPRDIIVRKLLVETVVWPGTPSCSVPSERSSYRDFHIWFMQNGNFCIFPVVICRNRSLEDRHVLMIGKNMSLGKQRLMWVCRVL